MKTLSLFLSLLFPALILAQAPPQGINYQGIIRDGSGEPVTATFDVQFKITDANGSYTEKHTGVNSNAHGLFTRVIGQGTPQGAGNFSSIAWASGNVTIEVFVDRNDGNGFQSLGAPSPFQSVPYALYSGGSNANTIISGNIPPAANTGNLGDFYLDVNTYLFYGPKTAGGWGAGTSLVGTPGTPGTNGANGTNGVNCWDGNGNGVGDPGEDANGDLAFNYLDCLTLMGGAWLVNGNSAGANDFIGTINNQPLVMKTNSTEKMRIAAAGNVGIATTNPLEKLDVTGGINSSLGYKVGNAVAVGGTYLRSSGGYFIPGSIQVSDLPAGALPWTKTGTNVFPTTLTDRVGIGTNTPQSPLSVIGAPTDTFVGRFTGSNTFGNGISIQNTLNNTTAVVFKGTSTNANVGYNPTGPSKLFIENLNPGGTVQVTANPKIRLNADTTTMTGYNNNNTMVGIGVNSPLTGLHVVSDNGVLFQGQPSFGAVSNLGPGNRMMWYSKKSAFRAGSVGGSQWDDSNIGKNSFAVGENTIARGNNATAMGFNSSASGDTAFALGTGAQASGIASMALGTNATASGTSALAIGRNAAATGIFSYSLGFFTNASQQGSVAIGAFAASNSQNGISIGQFVSTSNLATNSFVIGSGFNIINPLVSNTPNSIDMGMGSNVSTLHISPAAANGSPGKVGIGTTAPDQLLTVSNSTQPIIRLDRSTAGGFDWELQAGSNGFQIRGGANGFGGSLFDFVTVDGFGKTGIGNITPIAKLHVMDASNATITLSRQNQSNGLNLINSPNSVDVTSNEAVQMKVGTTTSTDLNFLTANTTRMTILGSGATAGNVGIGQALPTAKLEIFETNNPQIKMSRNGGSGFVFDYNSSATSILNYDNTPMNFATSGSNKMNIQGNGNVGIGLGVFTPSSKLDVRGGNVIIDAANDYKYRTAKTKTISLPCMAFVEAGLNNDIYDIISDASQLWVWAKGIAVGTTVYMAAPLYLPDSATITDFEVTFGDNNGSYGNTAELVRATAGGSTNTMATVSTSNAFAGGQSTQTTNSISNSLVETGVYKYWIRYTAVTHTANINVTALYGARITYTVTKAN